MAQSRPLARVYKKKKRERSPEVIEISDDDDQASASLADNIFVNLKREFRETIPNRSATPRHAGNRKTNEMRNRQTNGMIRSIGALVPVDLDGEEYRPFYSSETRPRIDPDALVWKGPTPFGDEDEGECREPEAEGDDENGEQDGASMVQSTRRPPKNGSKKKKRAWPIIESDSDSSDDGGEMARRINKVRRLSEPDDKDSADSNSCLASAIPDGLLKECRVLLKRLPKQRLEEAFRDSPVVRRSRSSDRESNSSSGSERKASEERVTREATEQRLAKLVKEREELTKKIKQEKRNDPTYRNVFNNPKEKKEMKESTAQKRVESDQNGLELLFERKGRRLSGSQEETSPTEDEGTTLASDTLPSISADKNKAAASGVCSHQTKLPDKSVLSTAAAGSSPTESVGLARVRKRPSAPSGDSNREISNERPARKSRSSSMSSEEGMDQAHVPQRAVEPQVTAQKVCGINAVEAIQNPNSAASVSPTDTQPRYCWADRNRQSLNDAIEKGRKQLENRNAQKTDMVCAKTPSNAQNTKIASASPSMKRISRVSPSKRKVSTEYVSPLAQGQIDASESAALSDTQASKTHIPLDKTGSDIAKRYVKRAHRMAHAQQQKTDAQPSPVPLPSKIPSKSILKSSPACGNSQGSQESRLVIDLGPKKKVTFADQPQIRYFESTKHNRPPTMMALHGAHPAQPVPDVFSLPDILTVEDEIVSAILKWNPNWLEEAKRMQDTHVLAELPPISPWPLLKVRTSYPALQIYFDTYKVQMLYEIWENLFYQYRTGSWAGRDKLECRVVNVVTLGQVFKDFSVVVMVDRDNVQAIRQNALVTFHLADRRAHDEHHQQKPEPAFLGLIVRSSWSSVRRLDEITPELRKCAKVTDENVRQFCHVKMTIRARWKTNMPSYEIGPMVVQIMSDISPMMRLVTALGQTRHTPLQHLVISPGLIESLTPANVRDLRIRAEASVKYNEEQLRAVSSCVAAITDESKATLQVITGTARSGKSQTVIGLIEELQLANVQRLTDDANCTENKRSKSRGIILVLASTAEKTDEISRLIIALNRFHQPNMPANQRFLKFVRLGERASVANDVARYCMDTLVEDNMRTEEAATPEQPGEDQSQITERIAQLKGQLHSFLDSQPSEADMALQKDVQDEISELEGRLVRNGKARKHHLTKVAPPEPKTASYLREYLKKSEEHKRRLLMHVDVVACTLNKNGEDLDLLKLLQWEEKISVLCAIVDDSSNATELETLIAAFVPVKKLFLFGQEEERRSTNVLSKIAYEHGFGDSLFSRILSNFEQSSTRILRLNAHYGPKV